MDGKSLESFQEQSQKGKEQEMKHNVTIRVGRPGAVPEHVLTSSTRRMRARIARLLFGDFSEVIILRSGRTVRNVNIEEVKEDSNDVQ